MPHYAAFHQGLHCLLLKTNQPSEKEFFFFFLGGGGGGEGIITCNPPIYTMDHTDLTVSMFTENLNYWF